MAGYHVFNKNDDKKLTNKAGVIDFAKKLVVLAHDEEEENLSNIDLEQAKTIIKKYGGKVESLPVKDMNK